MKKIINDPYQVVEETLGGILKAYPYHLRVSKDSPRALVRADAPIKGKVGICTGGGSGHIPVFLGYVGPGLLDGVSVGNVFSSPGADDMLAATKEVNGGAGVLYIFGNYSGDVMNFEMAAEMAGMEDIPVQMSIVKDDVVSAPRSEKDRRRAMHDRVRAKSAKARIRHHGQKSNDRDRNEQFDDAESAAFPH